MPYLYILQCNDETYYTGSTLNLAERVNQHEAGVAANYTKKRLPVALLYAEKFRTIGEAERRERQIQKWGHEKKKALIAADEQKLHELAECRNASHHRNAHLGGVYPEPRRGAR